jgi:demethylmenaquinone methyltransferase/2-methoxy-6-polyprenyl-1,4-benzoquinol methylase
MSGPVVSQLPMPTPTSLPPVAQQTEGPEWTDPLLANPHAVADKATRVNRMFSAIAPSYDLNNRLHSLWMDQHWRNVAVKMAGVGANNCIVDVACGTGDLTLKFSKAQDQRGPVKDDLRSQMPRVVGIDFTYAMLPIAVHKAQRAGGRIEFINGDAMALPLADASADVLSIAFGIRNVSDWGKAIDEFARVLRPGGRLIILEFSLPTNPVMRGLYNFYFRKIMPRTATLISGDKTGAYKYLPESVNTFISRQAMQERMAAAGFGEVVARPLTFGVCVCYRGVKK